MYSLFNNFCLITKANLARLYIVDLLKRTILTTVMHYRFRRRLLCKKTYRPHFYRWHHRKNLQSLEGVLHNEVSVLDVMLSQLTLLGLKLDRVQLMNKDSLDMRLHEIMS